MIKSKSEKPISVQKLEKKLAKVHDAKEKPPQRMKALLSFVGNICLFCEFQKRKHLNQMYKSYFLQVSPLFGKYFSIIYQHMKAPRNKKVFENLNNLPDRNKPSNLKDLTDALQPMKLLLVYIPDQIKKKWQIRSFGL